MNDLVNLVDASSSHRSCMGREAGAYPISGKVDSKSSVGRQCGHRNLRGEEREREKGPPWLSQRMLIADWLGVDVPSVRGSISSESRDPHGAPSSHDF